MRRTAFAALTGTIIYDGFNDFEMCGGFGRFIRSLKIAVVISTDYVYSLYGLVENTKEYNEVKFIHKNHFWSHVCYDKQFFYGFRHCEMLTKEVPTDYWMVLSRMVVFTLKLAKASQPSITFCRKSTQVRWRSSR